MVVGLECMLGLGQMGQTSDNLIRRRDCVINLPSEDLVTHVDRLALTTGKNPVPERKRQWGYRYERDKFGIAGFTPVESQSVAPPRVLECPIQMRASCMIPAFREECEFQRVRSAHCEAASTKIFC
jgi:flavin reductase (DIM6/NTAB) family NADH-FMN oxidoreductase RutF